MAKNSRRKNIILTNLPAAIALILMAVALRITLQFNFIISLLVLIVVYFILGVLIELIIDKIDAKKKKEDLFKTYAEGKSGQLPAFEDEPEEDEIAYEVKPKKEVVETSGKERRVTAVGSLYETEEEESPAFLRKEESTAEESATIAEAEIPEKEIPMFRNSTQESEAEPEQVSADETEAETEDEDSFLNIRIADLKSEHKETSASDRFFEETFNKKLNEIVADAAAEETISVPEAEAEPEETAVESVVSETEAAADTVDAVSMDAEEVEAEPVSEENVISEPEKEAETDVQEEPAEEAASEEEMPEVPEADEELIAALKDLGALNEESQEEIPAEEAEARRSLFDENDDFDAGFAERVKKNSSIIFGSVPDTDDDFEYIPVSDVGEYPVTAQKGKVKVDAKKIDDLYSFKKSKAGEKFFGRKKE